ncbi:MerR family transcriptional regulator [Pseudonocardia acaciae]|uniref:MerR family transcriptional regulator n=1 Tax=Pseudonocardia acaciae TaxID=551276 RepID=UPI00048B7A9A|nr:MerR family transcriptional regulator [Pseudonocardia acaciae]
MLIGELSRRTGVSRRLLRYYEEQGLLRPRRDVNSYRGYDEDAVRAVQHIRTLLAAGLSTEVIRQALPCATGDPLELEMCPVLAETLRRELAALDDRIGSLRAARGALASYLPS